MGGSQSFERVGECLAWERVEEVKEVSGLKSEESTILTAYARSFLSYDIIWRRLINCNWRD